VTRMSFTAATIAAVLLFAPARPGAAQHNTPSQSVTMADIQRLQDSIYDVSRDISAMRNRDQSLASQLQTELDDLRDDATYLKVKVRRNEPISRSEYAEVRDRIENIRSRARGETTGGYNPPTSGSDRSRPSGTVARSSNPNEVPTGTEFDVRLQNPLSSKTAQPEDRFEATTLVDLMQGDRLVVPAGSVMRGVVSSVNKAGHIERKGSLNVVFDQVTVRGRSYPIRATVEQALESEGIRGEAGTIGAGAGVGAIIGAILGGAKGALAGILVGGGGVIAATEGKDVELPVGTVLRVRLDSPLNVR
jgi:gas vesicle protein